jgi:hypothetical protein
VAIRDFSGDEVGSVQWGGRQGDRVMFEVKGERTPGAVEGLRAACEHRVTRVDSCADWDEPGAFEKLLGACVEVKRAHRLKGCKLGDWDDHPEDGRTLYIGAPTSTTRVRLYEKGKQAEYAHLGRLDWVRAEVQVRPAKEAKAVFAGLSAAQVWGASGWTRDLAGLVLNEHVDPHPAGTVYKLSERDNAMSWMCRQYGAHLVGLLQDLGSWDEVGAYLLGVMEKQRRQ